MQPVNLFELASQQSRWLAARQKVIANNIANVNTPEFVPSQIAAFKEVLNQNAGGLSLTHSTHLEAIGNQNGYPSIERTHGSPSEPEPKVRLEHELMDASGVRRSYELNTAIVKAFHRMTLMTTRPT